MNKRAVILSTAIVFGFFLVVLRLSDIMLINHGRLSKKARQQHTLKKDIEVARGTIYDRRGRELAVNIETDSLYCNPKAVCFSTEQAHRVSVLTSARYEDLLKANASNRSFLWIKRKLDPEIVENIKALKIEGIGFMSELKRFYPRGRLLSHVIGSVGIDNQALEGIEVKYDEELKKPGGKISVLRDADGWQLSEGTPPYVRGNSIVVTIDEVLQHIMEEEIDLAVKKWSASHAVAIMMDPYTGEIFAMASRPTYDPNNPQMATTSERRNRAITDLYEPGSTFKLITAVAGLDEGIVTMNTTFDCSNGSIKVGKWLISDVHRNSVLTFKEVIQESSNVGSVMIGLKLGNERLLKYARRFGFGEKTGIDLPGEAQGWMTQGTDDASTATVSIGYGVSATPIQILRAYSAIANGGILVTPHVVSEIRTPEGYVIYTFNSAKSKNEKRAISRKTASILKEILISVTEEGTAVTATVEGNRVAGKTGTTQMLNTELKKYSREKYASSFVGFVPADNPKIALIVVVFEPKGAYYGGTVAAPVFKAISEKALSYLNVPFDNTDEENTLIVGVKGIRK